MLLLLGQMEIPPYGVIRDIELFMENNLLGFGSFVCVYANHISFIEPI